MIKTISIALVLTLMSYNLHADSFKQLAQAGFDNMLSSSTGSSSTEATSNRMGSFAGGSMKIRAPTFRPKLFYAKAPSLTTDGCNGIDLNFGAFSFMSTEEVKNLLRATITQGTTYAFTLAMDAICGNCMSTMKALADKLNEIADQMVNSCELAKAAVNGMDGLFGGGAAKLQEGTNAILSGLTPDSWGGGDNPGEAINDKFTGWADAAVSPVTDFFKSTRELGAENPLDKLAKEQPAAMAKNFVNVTYELLTNKDIGSWFTNLAQDANEKEDDILMLTHIIGSVAMVPDPENLPTQSKRRPQITIHDILFGLSVPVAECDESAYPEHADKCLVYEEDKTKIFDFGDLDGVIKGYINEIEIGASDVNNDNNFVMNEDLKSFMKTDPLSVTALILNSGKYSGLMVTELDKHLEIITKEMIAETYIKIFAAVELAASNYTKNEFVRLHMPTILEKRQTELEDAREGWAEQRTAAVKFLHLEGGLMDHFKIMNDDKVLMSYLDDL
jgi:hypothetical protein